MPEHLLGFNDTYIRDGSAGSLLVRMCYLAAGVSASEHKLVNFNVRSTRHLLPNVACALQWSPDNCDETGRWAAKLDNTVRTTRISCADRYAQQSLRDKQRRLRLRLVCAVRSLVLSACDWRSLSLLPDFECITAHPGLNSSEYFGPQGA